MWINPENIIITERSHTDTHRHIHTYKTHESIHMKYIEKVNPSRQSKQIGGCQGLAEGRVTVHGF